MVQVTVARCLAIALHAAANENRLSWHGEFSIREALQLAGWDLLDYKKTPAE